MPKPSYIKLEIDGVRADIDPEGQVPTISYQLEDENDFEQKKSAEILDLELPATLVNDQIHNTLHNPSVLDTTPDGSEENFKPLRYIAYGEELLIGKYLAQSVVKKNGRPELYKGKAYGLNGDWVIELKEKTLNDFVNPRSHTFSQASVAGSWAFDGMSESLDFVYAPVRYRAPFHPIPIDPAPADADNVVINALKPSISIYWLLWRGFKSAGYRIVSTFMDTVYYRRSVMPWTWGGFDFIDDTRWEPLKFLAKPFGLPFITVANDGDYNGYPNFDARANHAQVPGSYDNSGVFSQTTGASILPFMLMWTYPLSIPLGKIYVQLSVQLDHLYDITNNSQAELRVRWYKNGIQVADQQIFNATAPVLGRSQSSGNSIMEYYTDVDPGDYIGARIYVRKDQSFFAVEATVQVTLEAFTLDFVRLGPGSTINLKTNYAKFKSYKWLDLLRGEIDCFDLSIQTDPIRKEVYIEPTHAYQIGSTNYPGYYDRRQLDWSQKVDLSRQQELELFSDFERELVFTFRDDPNDGGLKKIQDRNQTTVGMAKYVLPERYKAEKKEQENRFFTPVMHRDHQNFKYITGVAPQLIHLIPENVSNTSNDASENIFGPKRAWYKGVIPGFGGWRFEGVNYDQIPYMFAVNYKTGGETDPVFSYADQLIGGTIALGWTNRFFLQRMAILRRGRRYSPIYVQLNNYDVTNFLHRESIIIENIEYLLTAIQEYNPIEPESTACRMWMFVPVAQVDRDNSYPSIASIQSGTNNPMDVKWWPHLLLTSDITE